MTDAPLDPPATRDDVQFAAAQADDRARSLHAEILRELERLQRALVASTRSEVQHGVSATRAEIRMSREAAAHRWAQLLRRLDPGVGVGRSLLLAAAVGAATATLVTLITDPARWLP